MTSKLRRECHVLLIALVVLVCPWSAGGRQTTGSASPPPAVTSSVKDPHVLLQQALETVQSYRLHFRQTGDLESMASLIRSAQSDAQAAYDQFIAQSDFRNAAQSLITVADIQRMLLMQSPTDYSAKQTPVSQKYAVALELANKAKDPAMQYKALAGLSRADLNSKDYVAGSEHIAQMMTSASHSRSPDDLFNVYEMNAELERDRGNLSAANDYLNRALEMAGEVKDQFLLWSAYTERSDVYNDRATQCNYQRDFEPCQKAFQMALDDCQQSLNVAQRAGFVALATESQRRLGELTLLRDTQAKMAQTYQQLSGMAFRISKASQVILLPRFAAGPNPQFAAGLREFKNKMGGPGDAYNPLKYWIEGSLQEYEGNNDAALENYRKAVKLLETDRRKLGDTQGSGSFLSDRIDIYYLAAQQYLDRKEYAIAFEMLERSRARAMADLLSRREISLNVPEDQNLFSQSVKLKAQIGEAQNTLFNRPDASKADTDDEVKALRAKIDELQTQDHALELKIEQRAPKVWELSGEKAPVSLEAAQASARRGHYELLYYLATESGVVVWHIGADSVHVVKIAYGRSLLVDRVAALSRSLSDPHATFDQQDAAELFLVLVNPVLQYVRTQHLIIVPHEDLNQIPFQVLKNPLDGSFLGERFQISYAPSATILEELGHTPDFGDGHLLAVADPAITNAVAEVNAIGSLYSDRSKILTAVLPAKQDVKDWSTGYNLIHLSVHGVFDAKDPLLSYLKLHPKESAEGRFTAAEMFGLKLPSNSLVVLSACETGRAQVTHSNEVLGMVRGLLYSGASTLVLSSWQVDAKSTAIWMETFYREAQTRPPAEAAQLALLAVKRRPEFRHPFYWAAFLVTGQ